MCIRDRRNGIGSGRLVFGSWRSVNSIGSHERQTCSEAFQENKDKGELPYDQRSQCRVCLLYTSRVFQNHRLQFQFFCNFTAHGDAYEPFSMCCHKIYVFSCGMFCRANQVSFIFSILIVHNKDQLAFSQCLDAVSYTHLDVYKRQGWRKAREPFL